MDQHDDAHYHRDDRQHNARLRADPYAEQYKHDPHYHVELVVKTKPLPAQKTDQLYDAHQYQRASDKVTQHDTQNMRPYHEHKPQDYHDNRIDKIILSHILYD